MTTCINIVIFAKRKIKCCSLLTRGPHRTHNARVQTPTKLVNASTESIHSPPTGCQILVLPTRQHRSSVTQYPSFSLFFTTLLFNSPANPLFSQSSQPHLAMELAKGLREIQKLEGHSDRVWSLAWNPVTGVAGIPLSFASCSGDKTVRIWEHNPSSSTSSWDCKVTHLFILIFFLLILLNGTICYGIFNFGLQAVLDETHTRTVRSCAWSPSGKFLATASFDATTAIWENVGGDYECVSTLEV